MSDKAGVRSAEATDGRPGPARGGANAALDQQPGLQRGRSANARAGDASDIVGDPIGREALMVELASEMIPYTPEELIAIAAWHVPRWSAKNPPISFMAVRICAMVSARGKPQRTILYVNLNRLPFVNFSFKNFHAQRIQDVFLDRAFQRSRAINRVVAMARDECFRRIWKFERDLLVLKPPYQALELNLDDIL